MKKLTVLGIIACVGLLFTTPAAGDPAGPPGGLDVNVVNTEPIPVTGDVNATVTGDVNATVTGDVNATVTGEVSVTNVPEVYERIPFSAAYNGHLLDGNQEMGHMELDLPQELTSGIAVIEHVSIRVQQKPGSIPHIYSIVTRTGINPGDFVHNNLDLPQEGGTNKYSNWQASETVRLYHQLDAEVSLIIWYGRIGDATVDDTVFVVGATVSGYIVPSGAASLAP